MHLAHRLIAALLLLAYASTGTSLMPAVMTLLAEVEGSHESRVHLGENGAQVVLHHRQSEFTPAVNDHRRGLARVLVSFCQSDREGDHQMSTAQLVESVGMERWEISKKLSDDDLFNARATSEWQHLQQWLKPLEPRLAVLPPEVPIFHQPPSLLTTIQLLI